jgi:hypothetical protein
MLRYLNIITKLLLIVTMYSCKSIDTEVEYLKNWEAGAVISTNALNIFGEDNVFISTTITDNIYKRIYGKSYKIDCTIPLCELRYLKILHYDLDGKIHIGEVICNKAIESDLIAIFKELYKAKYPIERMILIDEYDADDEASMRDNNSSAFNYRMITGGGKLSKHALGLAIDINPLYNPYVKVQKNGQLHIEPQNAEPYIDRTKKFHYKIDSSDLCYKLFKQYGFEWGGDWDTRKDYQHFEK